MLSVPGELRRELRHYGQEHVLAWWEQLDDEQRRTLLDQLKRLELEQLQQLYNQREQTSTVPPRERIAAVPVLPADPGQPRLRQLGEDALRRGEVAVLLVAGGQGSRLGFDHPKGMYAIGPVSNKSLFQIHAEKVLALGRRYGRPLPFLVMTSPATDAETRAFVAEHRNFGLTAEQVEFFCQGTMPALDMATGKLLLEEPGRLFTSPNGHGGTLTALAESGLLERLRKQGIRQVFYFQVDNPLTKIADPVFLGQHMAANAEVSSKVVRKTGPKEKLGNLVQVDGRCTIIEYSDLPDELANERDASGQLRIWAGSIAIHLFAVDFLARVTQGATRIPFHIARKKVPYIDAAGKPVEPKQENAFKFEMFIFDVLPLADRWTVVETTPQEEFAPLKNASGADSPESTRQAMSNQAAKWLTEAGLVVPARPNGDAAVPLEISPLYALDAGELVAKVDRALRITGPTYLE